MIVCTVREINILQSFPGYVPHFDQLGLRFANSRQQGKKNTSCAILDNFLSQESMCGHREKADPWKSRHERVRTNSLLGHAPAFDYKK
jgi:hypothetical protein